MTLPRRLRPIIVPLLLLGLWQVATFDAGPGHRLPTPVRVVRSAASLLASGDLAAAMTLSLERVLLGFGVASAIALVLGTAMALVPAIGRNVDPIVESFRPIAPIALLPLAILWFGTGTPAAVFIVAYAAFFPMIVNTIHGIQGVDPSLVRAARTLGLSRLTIIRTVILQAAVPNLFVGARLALGVAWTSIIAAELAVGAKAGEGGTGGIGQMMFAYYAYSVDLTGIIVCMISVGLVALLIDRGLR